ncbi:cytochrome c biogenesis protein CcsA [Chloroflexi bacterium]|nr:cytochrome c biogenesis protein CcsA [Chloroflexota bacterium]RZP13613.1 MAG: heme lyase CcmF/NrfE family subunit [Chloroflexota bacterium]
MNTFGFYILILGFILSLYSSVLFISGFYKENRTMIRSASRSYYLSILMIFISCVSLITLFLSNDFTNIYVFNNSSLDMNRALTFVAFYAGNEGSLLYILLVHATLSGCLLFFSSEKIKSSLAYSCGILSLISSFYIFVLLFFANPFEVTNLIHSDGKGINPLLRHPGMYIHPPLLMSGLASISIPFVISQGALFDYKKGNNWFKLLRIWSLISWALLGAGLLIGAWWAYTILGWGGYWSWDPIENVGLMPWLVLTALIHSIMVEERRGMFRLWNIILVSLTFILALLGTFINRGGPVVSVHSFAASSLGFLFLGFMIVMTSYSLFTIIYKYKNIRESKNKIESYLSRETAFLLNNVLLVLTSLIILWGVLFPVVSIIFTGTEISVSAPYFNKTAGPILLAIILLMGIGPILSWRKTTIKSTIARILPSIILSIFFLIYLLLIGINKFFPVVSICSIFFVLTIIIREWIGGTRSRMNGSINPFSAFIKMIFSNRGRNGGYIVHLAILALAFGVVGTKFYDQRIDTNISISEEVTFKNYNIYFESIDQEINNGNSVTKANFSIYNNEKKFIGKIEAMHSYYPNYNQISVRSGILTNPIEDLYIIPKDFIDENRMTVRIAVNPLAWWIWASGPILLIGTVVTLWPSKLRKE